MQWLNKAKKPKAQSTAALQFRNSHWWNSISSGIYKKMLKDVIIPVVTSSSGRREPGTRDTPTSHCQVLTTHVRSDHHQIHFTDEGVETEWTLFKGTQQEITNLKTQRSWPTTPITSQRAACTSAQPSFRLDSPALGGALSICQAAWHVLSCIISRDLYDESIKLAAGRWPCWPVLLLLWRSPDPASLSGPHPFAPVSGPGKWELATLAYRDVTIQHSWVNSAKKQQFIRILYSFATKLDVTPF